MKNHNAGRKMQSFPRDFLFGQNKEIKGDQRRAIGFVLEHPLWTASQQMWHRVFGTGCDIPAQQLEMLSVSKEKALLHLAFLSIIDACSSHRRQVGRRGKQPCPAAQGQLRAGSGSHPVLGSFWWT